MTDLVERLRMEMRGERHADLAREAADEIERLQADNERLRAALEPFAEVARWAERNGHDLTEGWDMLLRKPDGSFAGHLQVQSPEFIKAGAALNIQHPTGKRDE